MVPGIQSHQIIVPAQCLLPEGPLFLDQGREINIYRDTILSGKTRGHVIEGIFRGSVDSPDTMHSFLGKDGAVKTIPSCVNKEEGPSVPAFPDLACDLPDISFSDNYGRNDSYSVVFAGPGAGYNDPAKSQRSGIDCHSAD